MRLGWYALWNLHVDGGRVVGLPTHIRYLRYLLDEIDGVRLFTNVLDAPRPDATDSIEDSRLEVVPLPADSFVSMWRNLGAVRRTFASNLDGLDAMVARLFDPCPWLLDAPCRARTIPLLMHMVGNPIEGIFLRDDWNTLRKWTRRAAFWPEEWLTLRAARRNRVIVNGSRLASFYARRGVRGKVVITSTLEAEDFASIERPAGEPTVVFVGYLRPPKRVELLLRSCAALTREGHPLQLRIVGGPEDSPYRCELETLADELQITGSVTFVGHVPLGAALHTELREAHVFGFPSASEGSPRVLLEAAASGLPLVSTDVGGVRDVFEPGESIELAPIDDADAFTAALRRMVTDPARRKRFAAAAQAKARAHLGPEFMRTLLAELGHRRDPATTEEVAASHEA